VHPTNNKILQGFLEGYWSYTQRIIPAYTDPTTPAVNVPFTGLWVFKNGKYRPLAEAQEDYELVP
jgi:hypothetical protein